jgi:hypothetical protein
MIRHHHHHHHYSNHILLLVFLPRLCMYVPTSQKVRGKIEINADLSHWVVVCEHVFDSNEKRDAWWPDVLALVAEHAGLIHCRVGHDEGPQVSQPLVMLRYVYI